MSLPVLSRRTVLRGLGTSLALPLLDCMRPASAAAAGAAAPVRMAFLYVPNGVHMQDWTPATTGGDFPLSCILEPLSDLRGKFSIHTGLAHDKAKANGDGPGDHARALATFLTGTQARKTAGADIRAGVSVDQLAAHHLGKRTRFPSLEIGTEGGGQSGSCDSGYSCVYSANIAWRSENQSVPKESNPRLIFERLFAGGRPGESAEARARREQHELSILDFVQDEAKALERRVGGADRRKLDEYFSAVREVERRIDEQRESQNVVVLDFPLLAENPRTDLDGVVVVDVPEEMAVRRLVSARGMSEADARARIARQATREERRKIADRVIDNSGDEDALRSTVNDVWSWMSGLRERGARP